LILFVVFLFLAIYNAGCMTALQLQHFGIYSAIGRESFAEYTRANIALLCISILLRVLPGGS
jgi:hypothetical protein